MAAIQREYKDRLFTFIFGREENRAWTLSLYNAVNGSHYTDPAMIRFNTIREILYLGMHNDVSFLIRDEISLYEQQSTYNPNMPVRMLRYTGSLFEGYLLEQGYNKYSRKRLQLPAPKLVVFYNGTDDAPDESVLRLSDSFPEGVPGDIEVTVRMININYGRSRELLEACEPLREYARLVEGIRERSRRGQPVEAAVDQLIDELPDNSVLKPFLAVHKAEVRGMLETEYDEAKVMELFRKEAEEDKIIARREGLAEGRAEGHTIGLAEGRAEGRAEGQQRLFRLLLKMNEAGEPADIQVLSENESELERLYKQYGIE